MEEIMAAVIHYYIKAANDADGSGYPDFTSKGYASTQSSGETRAPGIPAGVGAAAQSPSSILISWTAPSSGETPAFYNIWRSGSADGTYTEIDYVFAPDMSYTDTGLNPSTTYYYKVDAENTCHERGPQSSYVSATTQPSSAAQTLLPN
jgi:phosphodiesterase/alkaline phosphatase D-like protein